MKEKSGVRRRESFLLLYTIAFAVSCALVFRYFPETGKRMVWKGDGLSQHYVGLCYYARWGKAVLRSILAGHPAFPTFNMHMGFGADLFTTLQYYVIGDPFSLPAVFVPEKYMLTFHDAMIPARMYLAGICFERCCVEMGHKNTAGNLCGALLYVFSSFVLFGMRHPYFLNAMIWFPLLLIGAEHIFRGRKGRLFTVAVFVSCISNFYFFYMLVLMTVVYVVWRALRICLFPVLFGDGFQNVRNGDAKTEDPSAGKADAISGMPGAAPRTVPEAVKQIFVFAGKFLWRALLGTALGGCFLLPILLRFAQDPRASGGVAYSLLYPAAYYKGIPESFVGFGTEAVLENWTCLGLGGIGLLGVLLLFFGPVSVRDGNRSGHPDLKIAFVCMSVMTLLPAAGAVLNGFTYPANRWIWAFCLLTAYIAAVTLPSLQELSAGRIALVLLLMSAYTGVCAALDARRSTILELIMAAAAAAVVWAAGRIRKSAVPGSGGGRAVSLVCSAVLTGTILLTSVLHGYICFVKSVRFSGLEEYHTDQYIAAMIASDAAGMRSLLGNDTFYRYSGRYISNNFALLNNVSDTQYYWSLSDSRIEQFFTETGQSNGMVHLYDNLDNRTMLDEIAGVTYYKRSDGSLLPFGYRKLEGLHYDNRELFEEKEGDPLPVFAFSVFENQYALPLGFTTGNYLTRETYDGLTIPQRQEALMQGVLLEKEGAELMSGQEAELTFTSAEVPFSARPEEGIEIVRNGDGSVQLTVRDTEAALYLTAEDGEALSQAEISVLLTGMAYAATDGGKQEEQQHGELQNEKLQNGNPQNEKLQNGNPQNKKLQSGNPQNEKLQNGNPQNEKLQNGNPQNEKSQEEEPRYSNTDPVTVSVTACRNGDSVSGKEVQFTLPDNPWKTGRTDFLSCCGYAEEPLSELRLKFSRRGVYTFRELKVIRQPMDSYPAQARAFGEYVLEDLDLHELAGSGATDRITGTLTVPERRILCVQIPCSDGLRACVDGKEVPLLQADTMFCAMMVDAGTHEIELRYRTPGLTAGAGISAAALLYCILESLFERKRRKNTKKGTENE